MADMAVLTDSSGATATNAPGATAVPQPSAGPSFAADVMAVMASLMPTGAQAAQTTTGPLPTSTVPHWVWWVGGGLVAWVILSR